MKGPVVEGLPQGNKKSHRTGLFAFGIFLISFLLYVPINIPSKYYSGGDNLWTVPTAIMIVKNRTIDLSGLNEAMRMMPTSAVWINDMAKDPRLKRIGQCYYNFFPIGSALVSIPFVLADYRTLRKAANPIAESLRISRWSARVLAALSVSLLFVLLRQLQQSIPVSIFISGVFALATPHLSTHADTLWSHNVVLPFLIGSLCLLLADSERYCWLSALPLGFSYLIRPDSVLAIAVFSLYMLLYRRRYFMLFASLGVIIATVFLLWSHATYGGYLPPYYSGTRLSLSKFPIAAIGHLVSPNRGLLVFSPILFMSLLGVGVSFVRWTKVKPIFRFLSVLLVMHWLMISMFPSWWAGFSYGPRLFCSILPVWMVLFIPAIEMLRNVSRWKTFVFSSILAMVLLWSLFVQFRGVSDMRVHEWNAWPTNIDLDQAKIWNWHDMQILRGL